MLFYSRAVFDGDLAGIGGVEFGDSVFDGSWGSCMAAIPDVSSRIW